MRFVGTKTAIALLLVLLTGGYVTFRVVKQRRAQQHRDAAMEALERRDFRVAYNQLNACLEDWPDDTSVRLLAAQTSRRLGEFPEARRHFNLHQDYRGPQRERARELRLLAVQQDGDPTEVDALLDDCLKNPDASDGYLALEVVIEHKLKQLERDYRSGMTLVEGPAGRDRSRAEKALELWFAKRQGQADTIQGLIWRGKLRQLTDSKVAAADFLKVLEFDPDHFEARLNLAAALAEYDPRSGAWHLEILRQREPRNIQVCTLLAYFRRSLGQFDEAEKILDELLAANPEDVSALLERGKTALDAGHPEVAEGFLRKAVERAPQDPFHHLALSRCLHLIGKEEESKRHQRRYDELESERAKAERQRAEERRAAWRKRLEEETPRP